MESLKASLAHGSPGVATWIVLGVLMLWVIVAEPWIGYRGHRRFLHAVSVDPSARARFYREWTAMLVLLGGAVVACFAVCPELSLGQLGLGLATAQPADGEEGFAGFAVGAAMSAFVAVMLSRRKGGPQRIAGGEKVLAMLPRTATERVRFALLCLAAGTMEEIVWRGLVVFVVLALAPSASMGVLIAASAITFGIAHAYQGVMGMLATGLLGALFAALYLHTGSLLIPMVLHVLIDLRTMLLRVPPTPLPA